MGVSLKKTVRTKVVEDTVLEAGTVLSLKYLGMTPFLMHADDILWADRLEEARKRMKGVKGEGGGKAGDDRSPGWSWLAFLYRNAGKVALPVDVIMANLRYGGTQVIASKRGKTFKEASQSCLQPWCEDKLATHFKFEYGIPGDAWRELDLPADDAELFDAATPFRVHTEWAEKRGFTLFAKRVRVGQSKHIRVRARFENWRVTGQLRVTRSGVISLGSLTELVSFGGLGGLGDWRPNGRTPGTFGQATATIEVVGQE